MEYDLFGGYDYDGYELFGGYSQKAGGSKRYQAGWKSGIPKKPGYKLVKVNGEPLYIKKKPRYLLGYNVFVGDFRKKNMKVEGPSLMKKAGAAWSKLSVAQKATWKKKAEAKGKIKYSGPPTRKVAKAHMSKLNKRKRSKSKRRSKTKSRRRYSNSKSRSRKRSKSRSRKRSKSRSRKRSKSRSKCTPCKSKSRSRSRSRGKNMMGMGQMGFYY